MFHLTESLDANTKKLCSLHDSNEKSSKTLQVTTCKEMAHIIRKVGNLIHSAGAAPLSDQFSKRNALNTRCDLNVSLFQRENLELMETSSRLVER